MRKGFAVFLLLLLVFLFTGGLPGLAGAQGAAVQKAVSTATGTASGTAPAKPASSTIIPGSPLAVLTGAGAGTDENQPETPSPFGTDAVGLSVTQLITHEAAGTFRDFFAAIRKSTQLTPVWQWLQTFPESPAGKQQAAGIADALAITVLPALLIEAAIRFALGRPRAGLVQRAVGRQRAEDTAAEADGLAAAEAGDIEARPRRRDTLLAWGYRLGMAVLVFLLGLAPVVAFGVAVGTLLATGLVSARDARLSVIGLSNAYLFCRFTLEFLRFLVAPERPALRLVNVTDARARWLTKWVRILLVTGGSAFVVISIGEILGLPVTGRMALTRIMVLAVHVELAIMVWVSRKTVAAWIAGRPDGFMAATRRRLGSIWHYVALFYILALWVAWAGGVRNAFGVLLRVVLFFIAAVVLARLAWAGTTESLDRLFPDPAKNPKAAKFFSRARVYNPLIRVVIRVFIFGAAISLVLLGWGVNVLPWLLKNPISHSLISAFLAIIVTVAVALVLWEIANGYMNGRVDRLTSSGKTRQALRLRTLAPILKATIGTTIGLIAGLICLSKIGVNAAPLLAGAGVLGIAIGFGSQKLVQDIITGLFLLLEDTMQVGDVVTLAGMSGTVERLSIRTIRLRGGDGSVNVIPFSAVTTVTNQTRDFGYAQISVGVGYEENVDHVCAVLMDIARTMRSETTWGSMMRDDLQIFGLDQFGASALMITGQIRTGPGQHWAVRREFNRRVLLRFNEEHIEIPYTYLPPGPPEVPPAPPVTQDQGAPPRETPGKGSPLPADTKAGPLQVPNK